MFAHQVLKKSVADMLTITSSQASPAGSIGSEDAKSPITPLFEGSYG